MWPTEDLPELREAFRELGTVIIEAGLLVAKACDKYVATKNPESPLGRLEDILRQSRNPKGRLLHYYPSTGAKSSSNWCAKHTDHGSLTGLLSSLANCASSSMAKDPHAIMPPGVLSAGSFFL